MNIEILAQACIILMAFVNVMWVDTYSCGFVHVCAFALKHLNNWGVVLQ